MKLLIMTRGRIGKQITLQSIPRQWLERTYLVVPMEEHNKHEHQTLPVPSYVDNYSKKFQWILDGGAGEDNKVVIMDDDLTFSKRVGSKLLKVHDINELNQMFFEMEYLLDTTPLVGVHPRQMGHQAPLPYAINGKVICVQGVNRELCRPMPRVSDYPILADVFFNCSLLERGQGNKLITTFVQDHASCQAPGGCSIYRTPEMQKEAVQAVADRWPDFAKVVIRKPKQAKWMGDERFDLRVQWKKLYQWGSERLGSEGF